MTENTSATKATASKAAAKSAAPAAEARRDGKTPAPFAFMAYNADFTSVHVFRGETSGAVHAARNGLRLAPLQPGDDIREAARRHETAAAAGTDAS
jgi:hypothetical protein